MNAINGFAAVDKNDPRLRNRNSLVFILAFSSLVSSLFIYAFVAELMGPAGDAARLAAIVITGGLAITGMVLCVLREKYLAAFLSAGALSSIWIYLGIFAYHSHQPLIWTSGGEYIGVSLLALFSLVIEDRQLGRLLRWYYLLCVGYAVFYIVATYALRAGLLDVSNVTRILAGADDAGRGDRLQFAVAAIVFGLAYSLSELIHGRKLVYALAALLFSFVWILSGSRAITWVTIFVMLSYLAVRNAHVIAKCAFIGFALGTIFSFTVLWWPDLNPFFYFTDASASTRVFSVDIVRWSFSEYWLTGAGISFGEENYAPLTLSNIFFPGDIGMVGILYMYGIVGVFLYCLICYYGCNSHAFIRKLGYGKIAAESLALTAVVLTLYSLQSPQFNGGSSGSVFATLFGALALASYGLRSRSPRFVRPTGRQANRFAARA